MIFQELACFSPLPRAREGNEKNKRKSLPLGRLSIWFDTVGEFLVDYLTMFCWGQTA
jgi:hypothetical protein